MTATAHLQALLQRRQWELDAAAMQLRRSQQLLQQLRGDAARLVAGRQDVLAAARQPGSVSSLDGYRRRLLLLAGLEGQSDRLQAHIGEAEAALAQAHAECARRLLQLQALRERHDHLHAALRQDLLRRQARDSDVAHLVCCAASIEAEGMQA